MGKSDAAAATSEEAPLVEASGAQVIYIEEVEPISLTVSQADVELPNLVLLDGGSTEIIRPYYRHVWEK